MNSIKKLITVAVLTAILIPSCHGPLATKLYSGWKDTLAAAGLVKKKAAPKRLVQRQVKGNTLAVRKVEKKSTVAVSKPAALTASGYDVRQTGHVTAEQLERHFASRGESVLKGKGEFFIQMEKKYNVSALFMAGIATQESGGGTSARARRVKDSFGMTGKGRGKRWATHEENIEDAFRLVSGKLYVKSGRKTPEHIGRRYCTTRGWASRVAGHMRKIVVN